MRTLPVKPDPRLTLALLLAGCQGAPLPDTSVAEVRSLGASYFQSAPRVQESVPADGMARARVSLTVTQGPAPRLQLLALPNTGWSQAMVSLFSPSVNTSYDPSLHLRTISSFTTTHAPTVTNPGSTSGSTYEPVAVAPDGSLYTGTPTGIGRFGGAAFGAAADYAGMAFDAAGSLFASDVTSQRVVKISPDGLTTTQFFKDTAVLTAPRGVAVDREGNVYVADQTFGTVVKLTPAGAATNLATGINGPTHLALDPAGNVYATTAGADVVKIPPTGAAGPAALVNASPETLGGLAYANGALLLSYVSKPAIDRIDLAATPAAITSFLGSALTAALPGAAPFGRDLAADKAGTLYAVEAATHQVWRVTPDTHFLGNVTFPPLRPASDYAAQVYMQGNGTGTSTLAGSQAKLDVSLVPGVNNLDFAVQVNGTELSYQLNASGNNNVVSGNAIVQGDVVTLATGVDASQPGVDHLVLELSGGAYGGATATVGVLTSAMAASWNAFTWNTGTSYTLPDGITGAAGYVPAKLTPGGGRTSAPGTLTVKAYDLRNNLVGTAAMTLAVYGRPLVGVNLH
jgi:hypothetical protein